MTVKERTPTYNSNIVEAKFNSLTKTVSKRSPQVIRVIYIPYKNSDILKELFFPFADIQSFDNSCIYNDYVLKNFDNIDDFSKKLLKIIRSVSKIRNRPSKRHYLLLPTKEFFKLLYDFYYGDLDEIIFSNIKQNRELHFMCLADKPKPCLIWTNLFHFRPLAVINLHVVLMEKSILKELRM